MNTYEKIIAGVIGLIIIAISVFSYFELTEDAYKEFSEKETSDFEESFGSVFVMGSFTEVLDSTQSAEREGNCALQKPVLVSVLHDINEELETSFSSLFKGDDDFEVNQETLDILCAKNATITLRNKNGDTLQIEKVPFIPNVPAQQYNGQLGTQVELRATVTEYKKDETESESETFSRTMLIPYKMLE